MCLTTLCLDIVMSQYRSMKRLELSRIILLSTVYRHIAASCRVFNNNILQIRLTPLCLDILMSQYRSMKKFDLTRIILLSPRGCANDF